MHAVSTNQIIGILDINDIIYWVHKLALIVIVIIIMY